MAPPGTISYNLIRLFKKGGSMYSGFLSRLWSIVIDFLVILPISLILLVVAQKSMIAAIFATLLTTVIYLGHQIWGHFWFGQTIGKWVAGIKVVNFPDESKLTLSQCFMRSSVDITLSAIRLVGIIWASFAISQHSFNPQNWAYLESRFRGLDPTFGWIGTMIVLWTLSEAISLLLSDERRSLQDWLGGTAVIKVERSSWPVQIAVSCGLLLFGFSSLRHTEKKIFKMPPQTILAGSGLSQENLEIWKSGGLIKKQDRVIFFHSYEFAKPLTTILTDRHLIRKTSKSTKRYPINQITQVKRQHDFGGKVDIQLMLRGQTITLRNLPLYYGKRMFQAINLARNSMFPPDKTRSLKAYNSHRVGNRAPL